MDRPRVTLAQVDSKLDAVKSAAARLGAALFELDEARGHRIGETARLEGASAARWREAGEQLTVLWAWYQAIEQAVSQVDDHRRVSKLRPVDLSELWKMLSGAWVEVSEESLSTARRCLPAGAALVGSRAAIDVLLNAVTTGYQGVAETMASLSAVRDMVVPRLDEIDDHLRAEEARARSGGIPIPDALIPLRDLLDELRKQADSDPLSFEATRVAPLAVDVQRIGSAVQNALAAVASVDDRLEEIHAELDGAAEDVSAASDLAGQAAEKIAGSDASTAEARRLSCELKTLGAAFDEARAVAATDRAAADRLARDLASQAAALRSDAARLLEMARRPLARRQELRGRLGAYQAKAHALNRAEEFTLDQLYRSAEEALYVAPCDLAAAERRITAYQMAILEPRVEDRS